MSDWLSMEQQVSRAKAEAEAMGKQYLEWQPPRRKALPFAWLARLFHRRKSKKVEEPQPARPAFR